MPCFLFSSCSCSCSFSLLILSIHSGRFPPFALFCLFCSVLFCSALLFQLGCQAHLDPPASWSRDASFDLVPPRSLSASLRTLLCPLRPVRVCRRATFEFVIRCGWGGIELGLGDQRRIDRIASHRSSAAQSIALIISHLSCRPCRVYRIHRVIVFIASSVASPSSHHLSHLAHLAHPDQESRKSSTIAITVQQRRTDPDENSRLDRIASKCR